MNADLRNPHESKSLSLISMISGILKNRQLLRQMIVREIGARYRGSIFGIGWSIMNPVIMLSIYTFVFSQVFKMKWDLPEVQQGKIHFALMIFSSLIFLNLFNEMILRAPNLIVANVNYVKKVIFPIETLAVMAIGSALFHSMISILILVIFYAFFNQSIPTTAPFIILILIPFACLLLGCMWILSSLGVFIRDVGQNMGVVASIMTFLSPVFYPIEAVPDSFRWVFMLNPLTFVIEQARRVLILQLLPDWIGLGIYSLVSIFIMWMGYVWFQKTRVGFADVL